MQYKILTTILDYQGKVVEKEDKLPLTFRDVVFQSLNTILDQDKVGDSSKKVSYYMITKKVFDSETPDLSVEEVSQILERVKFVFVPLVVGRADEFFNRKSEETV